jgi:hypothetical protein
MIDVTFRAASPGQTLSLTWEFTSTTISSMFVHAATLFPTP